MKKIIVLKMHSGKVPEFAKFCILNEVWTIFSYSNDGFLSGTEVTIFICTDTEEKEALIRSKYANHIQSTETV